MTNFPAFIAQSINEFAEDLKNSTCMGTRKDSIRFLANKIGAEKANQVAEVFGLVDSYYKI